MSARWSTLCESSACSVRHEIDGPHEGSRSSQAMIGRLARHRRISNQPRQSQVQNAHRSGCVEHQIARFDVAVDDASRVGRLQAARGLDHAVDRRLDRQGAAVADHAIEIAPFHVFHGEEIDAAVLARVEHSDHVGVVQPRCGLHFATKADHEIMPARKRRRQDFECHDPVGQIVACLEDDAHAAGTELVKNEITPDDESALPSPA